MNLFEQLDALLDRIVQISSPDSHIVIMSNGGFGGIHQKLVDRLKTEKEK